MITAIAGLVLALPLVAAPLEPETISFPSQDGLEITADLWIAHEDPETPFIVMFHQAGWSRGEYGKIATRVAAMGFNCMAVDARSGGKVNGVVNETAKRAAVNKKKLGYTDALPDLTAALELAREKHAKGRLIAWGSSYSAALVFVVAAEHPELVDGILSFAPGEYFEREGKPADWIATSARKVTCPAFITSARAEEPQWKAIFEALPETTRTSFVPRTKGNHGSRALWKEFEDSAVYWQAVTGFLTANFLSTAPGELSHTCVSGSAGSKP